MANREIVEQIIAAISDNLPMPPTHDDIIEHGYDRYLSVMETRAMLELVDALKAASNG